MADPLPGRQRADIWSTRLPHAGAQVGRHPIEVALAAYFAGRLERRPPSSTRAQAMSGAELSGAAPLGGAALGIVQLVSPVASLKKYSLPSAVLVARHPGGGAVGDGPGGGTVMCSAAELRAVPGS